MSSRSGARPKAKGTDGGGGRRRRTIAAASLALLAIAATLNAIAFHRLRDCLPHPAHSLTIKESSSTKSSAKARLSRGRRSINATFLGIASAADRVGDAAIRFLLEASCVHGARAFVLLGEKGGRKTLDRKIRALAHHWHSPRNVRSGVVDSDSDCKSRIGVWTAPSHEELVNITRSHLRSAGELGSDKSKRTHWIKNSKGAIVQRTTDDPLDPTSRVARIKRSREHQRQRLLQLPDPEEMEVVGVLDLDLFAYPTGVPDVMDVASEYILPSKSAGDRDERTKFHAMCANGVQWSRGKRSYYDTFSTILLPNSWLHRNSDRWTPRGKLEGEDVALAGMTQREALEWFLREGGGFNATPFGAEPVPVRSCFGGFAMYRADVFFDARCRYDAYTESDDYVAKGEMHTCEHVAFHECLRRALAGGKGSRDQFRIAVKPDLFTLWHLTD
ncbi:hypothetical protein ACHAWF_014744 [Thalassiosira exigua]